MANFFISKNDENDYFLSNKNKVKKKHHHKHKSSFSPKYWEDGREFKRIIPRFVLNVLETLKQNNHEAYIVGGAIRDFILNEKPKDFDLVTSATPQEIKPLFRKQRARIIGRRFKIIHVLDREQNIYEISTFRRTPHPHERNTRQNDNSAQIWNDNHYGNITEDAWRRDFSINSLYYDPDHEEEIVDITNGLEDLKNFKLRILGNAEERIDEDPVRLIRALKMIAQYNFIPEEDLNNAITNKMENIKLASFTRLSDEMLKIVLRPFSLTTFNLLYDKKCFQYIWPQMNDLFKKPEIKILRNFLSQRDYRIKKEDLTLSKSFAYSILILPFVFRKLKVKSVPSDLWVPSASTYEKIQEISGHVFSTLPIANFLIKRASTIINLLPLFFNENNREKLVAHEEYKYAKELFKFVINHFGLSSKLLTSWPDAPSVPRRKRNEQNQQTKIDLENKDKKKKKKRNFRRKRVN